MEHTMEYTIEHTMEPTMEQAMEPSMEHTNLNPTVLNKFYITGPIFLVGLSRNITKHK